MTQHRRKTQDYPELYTALVRLHILHHAAEGELFGLGIIEELGRHGYRLSPGTLYPILHGMEKNSLLRSRSTHGEDGRSRRMYSATANGRRVLKDAKDKVRELFGELFEDE
jgi:PadR family transcriptional regulator PadR